MDTLSLNLFNDAVVEAPDTAEYMGFWRRLGARAIDTALHWVISFVVGFGLAVYLLAMQEITGNPAAPILKRLGQGTFAGIAFSLLGSVMYLTIAEGFHGSTLGKRLLGMVVLNESKSPCGFFAALGRQIVFFYDGVFFGLVGAYAMSTNHRDQRYGDQWCKTVVVKRSTAPAGALRSNLRFCVVLFLAIAADGLVLLHHYANMVLE